jgi:hypothetical protein
VRHDGRLGPVDEHRPVDALGSGGSALDPVFRHAATLREPARPGYGNEPSGRTMHMARPAF